MINSQPESTRPHLFPLDISLRPCCRRRTSSRFLDRSERPCRPLLGHCSAIDPGITPSFSSCRAFIAESVPIVLQKICTEKPCPLRTERNTSSACQSQIFGTPRFWVSRLATWLTRTREMETGCTIFAGNTNPLTSFSALRSTVPGNQDAQST